MDVLEKLKILVEKVKSGNVENLTELLDDLGKEDELEPVMDKIRTINTEISNLDEKYVEQKRIYNTLVNNLPGAVYRCENEIKWPFSYVSDGIESITGYTSDQFIDRQVFYGDLIAKDYQSLVWDEVQRALEAKIPFRLVYKIIDKNGNEKWVWEQGSGVYGKDGQLIFLEGFITEITDKIKLQAEREEDMEKLETINKALMSRELNVSKLKEQIGELKKQLTDD